MLEMRNKCERCEAALPPESKDAFICSHECTWCRACTEGPLDGTCPNCKGVLEKRPVRVTK